ncbi:MAG: mechanosensitive ion channel [Steroidobacteraceae bacterium]|nr:mechanosensitive ion channel [Deltaproteobacteria bacterium]
MVLAALLAGVLLYRILFSVLARLAGGTDFSLNMIFVDRMRAPARLLLPLFALMLLAPSLSLPAGVLDITQHFFSLCLIGLITWLVITVTLASRDIIISRYDIDARESFKARAVHTQLTMIIKVILVIVVIIALASMLMSFDKIRAIGVSILASAGIMGIIVGFAAQRSLATLLAGLQIAITQPIRINDTVIVEGEWGTIEEITLTYVVVKIWDLRRMVVPVTFFLEKSFQNWTRSSTNILGTVFLYVDYAAPVPEIRSKLLEFLQESQLWDREVWNLQVTNAGEHVLELRSLMSAVDAPTSWDLRCEVREKLVAFLKETCPESLPRTRAEFLSGTETSESCNNKLSPA